MTLAHSQSPIVGRGRLIGLITEVASGVAAAPQAVILVGEPGIGKSTLLRHAVATLEPQRAAVLFAGGSEPDHVRPFTALTELIWPIAERIDELPPPLRDALRDTVNGGPGDEWHGPALIQQAVLALFAVVAADRPLVIVLDDFDRFEPDSRQVLTYAIGRVPHLAVRLLISARRVDQLNGLDRSFRVVEVAPLTDAAAAELIETQTLAPDASVRGEIIRWSGGNPLALIESARFYGKTGSVRFRGNHMVGSGFAHALFAEQLSELPPDARRLTLFAAAGAGYETIDTITAAAGFGADLWRWQPAMERSLVSVTEDRRVQFSHALLRSVAYSEGDLADRRTAHIALAASPQLDVACRAWHLAAAAAGPDETVASLLEQGSERSRQRGGYLEVARALQRAAELSPGAGDAARRFTLASVAANFGGDPSWALSLNASAVQRSEDPEIVGHAALTRASVLLQSARPAEAAEVVRSALDGAPPSNPRLRLALMYTGASSAYYSGELAHRSRLGRWLQDSALDVLGESAIPTPFPAEAGPVQRAYIAMYAQSAGSAHDRPAPWDRRWLHPMPAPVEPFRRLVVGAMAYATEDSALAVTELREAVEQLKAAGGLRGFTFAIAPLAWGLHDTGRWSELRALLAETDTLCGVYDLALLHAESNVVRAHLLSCCGDTEAADAAIEAASRVIADKSGTATRAALTWATGRNALARSEFDSAYQALRQMFDADGEPTHFVVSHRAIADLAWAGARSSNLADARPLVASIGRQLGSNPPVRLRLLRHQALALTATTHLAERHFRLAIFDPAGDQWPMERARARLHYGEWLRRVRRPAEARTQLTAGLEVFERLGAAPYAQIARAELRAAGVTASTAGAVSGLDSLTAQERQIVSMAASGLTNPEIGQRLNLSPRTIASHLYNVYPKLGVSRRHQLRDLLGDAPT
ncbi:AAA family ATPase [Mycolicibacterium mucogenicum]|uniref:helix-turn-helix transcriptional regulator n=1 Tax=Mycolicibacterium mucogenicum TaxID=56689 RepID=UPI00226A1130|nr:AAA family ATPase [Mycolicibacterium mucogenicum]MCX8562412.1 AAA family ATPase [Mycolicibacterium mucogenicum]